MYFLHLIFYSLSDLLDGVPVKDLVTLGGGRIVEAATFLEPLTVSGDLKVSVHLKARVSGTLKLGGVFSYRVCRYMC